MQETAPTINHLFKPPHIIREKKNPTRKLPNTPRWLRLQLKWNRITVICPNRRQSLLLVYNALISGLIRPSSFHLGTPSSLKSRSLLSWKQRLNILVVRVTLIIKLSTRQERCRRRHVTLKALRLICRRSRPNHLAQDVKW